jgi:hypothetical protein
MKLLTVGKWRVHLQGSRVTFVLHEFTPMEMWGLWGRDAVGWVVMFVIV